MSDVNHVSVTVCTNEVNTAGAEVPKVSSRRQSGRKTIQTKETSNCGHRNDAFKISTLSASAQELLINVRQSPSEREVTCVF